MWEVEIVGQSRRGVGWDEREEKESVKGKEAVLHVEQVSDSLERRGSELAFSENLVSTWHPLGAAAMVPITTPAPKLCKRASHHNAPAITSTAASSSPSSKRNREQAADEVLAAMHTGSSVQVSVLIAMPVAEAVVLRRMSKSTQCDGDEEELPELEIGYASIDVDEGLTSIIPSPRAVQAAREPRDATPAGWSVNGS